MSRIKFILINIVIIFYSLITGFISSAFYAAFIEVFFEKKNMEEHFLTLFLLFSVFIFIAGQSMIRKTESYKDYKSKIQVEKEVKKEIDANKAVQREQQRQLEADRIKASRLTKESEYLAEEQQRLEDEKEGLLKLQQKIGQQKETNILLSKDIEDIKMSTGQLQEHFYDVPSVVGDIGIKRKDSGIHKEQELKNSLQGVLNKNINNGVIAITVVLIGIFIYGIAFYRTLTIIISVIALFFFIISYNNAVSEVKARKEEEERRIARLLPYTEEEIIISDYLLNKEECDKFYKYLKKEGELEKNPDYGMTKKNLIENREWDEVFEYKEVCIASKEFQPDGDKINVFAENYFIGSLSASDSKKIIPLLENTHFDLYWQGRKYKKIEDSSYGDEVLVKGEKDLFTIKWEERNEEYYKYYNEDGSRKNLE